VSAFAPPSGAPDAAVLKDLVARIRSVGPVRRVILFGSAARGTMGPDSDLDVLVVVPEGTHRRARAEEIYRRLRGFGIATDVVVATERDLADHADDPWRVYSSALAEGKDLIDAL
jgi:predicted nucleotidyltransferase